MAHAVPLTGVSNEVATAIRSILKNRLGSFGFTRATINAGENHAGEPALFIDAHYKLSETPVDSAVTAETRSELRQELLSLGEDRFPYLRHHFAKGQRILGVR